MAAHAEAYNTPAGNHPSEPNYIWLESGSNLGITDDNDPSSNHQSTTDHLTTHLEAAGITWKAYSEGISGTDCPQADNGDFYVRHTPQLFFDDVTNHGDKNSQHCIQHVRPYTELATDLAAGTVARYNFITPDVCHDMHGETFGFNCFAETANLVKEGDTWLSTEIPKIMASAAYQNGGVIFIIWDEGDESLGGTASDGPLPFFAISSKAKAGYAGTVAYTHSSTLRSVQEIFGISPFMRDAGNATDLSDLFTSFP
jgi:phospholipase C